MVQIILFPFLSPWDLIIFSQLNKSCNQLLDPNSKHCVNFKVLFRVWGIILQQAEVEQTLVSTFIALHIAAKWFISKSITKSQHIIGKNEVKNITEKVSIPNIANIADKSLKNLQKLLITHVYWNSNSSIGIELSDGQFGKAGSYGFIKRHVFDTTKKITKVECMLN